MQTKLILFVLAGVCARADEARLDALIDEALAGNPEVTAAQKRYEAARQRPSQAASLPDTMFAAGWNAAGRPWPGAGLGAEPVANIGFMVSQEIPWPGKRKLRGEVAEVEAGAELESLRSVRLSIASRVTQAYMRLAYTYTARGVLERNRQLLRRLLSVSEIRYSVGKAAQQDVLKIQTQLSILDTKLIQLERERGAREAELASLLNRKPGASLGEVDLPKPPPFTATLESLLGAARKQSPMLRREEKMIQRNQAAVDLARKDFYPDYAVAGGYYNMGGMRDMYMFRVDFKLPTSWFRKQRPAVAESVHMLAGSRKSLEAAAQDVAYRIQDEYLAATTAQRLMKLYEESIVPQSNLTLESSLSSYESGAVDLLTVLMNFITVLDIEMNYYSEQANYLVALARLREMTGAPL